MAHPLVHPAVLAAVAEHFAVAVVAAVAVAAVEEIEQD